MSAPPAQRLTLPMSSSSSSGPLPAHLRSALNDALLASASIPGIQAALLHECQASGFVAALRARTLELLRTGECASYGDVLAAVTAELRGGGGKDEVNGLAGDDGKLKVPQRVVEEGVRVVRSALEGCIEVGGDD